MTVYEVLAQYCLGVNAIFCIYYPDGTSDFGDLEDEWDGDEAIFYHADTAQCFKSLPDEPFIEKITEDEFATLKEKYLNPFTDLTRKNEIK